MAPLMIIDPAFIWNMEIQPLHIGDDALYN
jgi:hypothetical protein